MLPIDDRLLERTNAELVGRPTVMEGRNTITYGPGMKGMGVDIFIATPGKSYTMTADVDVQAGANGVIVAQGGRFGGFSFFVKTANRPSSTTIWAWRNLPLLRRKPSARANTPSFMNSNPMADWVKAASERSLSTETRSAKAASKRLSRAFSPWMTLPTSAPMTERR